MEATSLMQTCILTERDGSQKNHKALVDALHLTAFNFEILQDRIEDRFETCLGRVLLAHQCAIKTNMEFEAKLIDLLEKNLKQEGIKIAETIEKDVMQQATAMVKRNLQSFSIDMDKKISELTKSTKQDTADQIAHFSHEFLEVPQLIGPSNCTHKSPAAFFQALDQALKAH